MVSNICLLTEPLRRNYCVRFDFSVATVLSACLGDQVSFNTTVGDVVLLKDNFERFY